MILKYNKYTTNKQAFEIVENYIKGNNYNKEFAIDSIIKAYGEENASIIIDQANFYRESSENKPIYYGIGARFL